MSLVGMDPDLAVHDEVGGWMAPLLTIHPLSPVAVASDPGSAETHTRLGSHYRSWSKETCQIVRLRRVLAQVSCLAKRLWPSHYQRFFWACDRLRHYCEIEILCGEWRTTSWVCFWQEGHEHDCLITFHFTEFMFRSTFRLLWLGASSFENIE